MRINFLIIVILCLVMYYLYYVLDIGGIFRDFEPLELKRNEARTTDIDDRSFIDGMSHCLEVDGDFVEIPTFISMPDGDKTVSSYLYAGNVYIPLKELDGLEWVDTNGNEYRYCNVKSITEGIPDDYSIIYTYEVVTVDNGYEITNSHIIGVPKDNSKPIAIDSIEGKYNNYMSVFNSINNKLGDTIQGKSDIMLIKDGDCYVDFDYLIGYEDTNLAMFEEEDTLYISNQTFEGKGMDNYNSWRDNHEIDMRDMLGEINILTTKFTLAKSLNVKDYYFQLEQVKNSVETFNEYYDNVELDQRIYLRAYKEFIERYNRKPEVTEDGMFDGEDYDILISLAKEVAPEVVQHEKDRAQDILKRVEDGEDIREVLIDYSTKTFLEDLEYKCMLSDRDISREDILREVIDSYKSGTYKDIVSPVLQDMQNKIAELASDYVDKGMGYEEAFTEASKDYKREELGM